MKKIFPHILILLIFVQMFAPFSGFLNSRNKIFSINKAEATNWGEEWDTIDGFRNAFKQSSIKFISSSTNQELKISNVDLRIRIDTGLPAGNDASGIWSRMEMRSYASIPLVEFVSKKAKGSSYFNKEKEIVLIFKENSSQKSGYIDITTIMIGGSCGEVICPQNPEKLFFNMRVDPEMPVAIEVPKIFASKELSAIGEDGLSQFTPGESYTVTMYYQAMAGSLLNGFTAADDMGEDIFKDGDADYFPIASTEFTTATVEQQTVGDKSGGDGNVDISPGKMDFLPECTLNPVNFHIGGCIAQGLYYLLFKTTSFVFAFSGSILDYTLMYSTNDSSYRSEFVVQGWKIIRDLCNMFFIFILLYIAIATILNLHGVNTKSMIVNVVLIGLLINFSLFATQIIIDTSNIVTRLFYNQKTMIANDGQLGPAGEIPISSAIVAKVNPQRIILEAGRVSKIKVVADAPGEKQGNITAGNFILITLLATAVNIVGIIAFLSAAIIFISRVIGLWLAMILSPLAFFSYTVPALQGMKIVGWKHWWSDTVNLALIGPVFVFFMYLIVKFLSSGLGMVSAANSNLSNLGFLVATIVPFVFIMVLLIYAKNIAKSLSGEIGQTIIKGVSAAGAVALGGAALGTAVLGRNIIGRGLTKLGNNDAVRRRIDAKNDFEKKLSEWNKTDPAKRGVKPTLAKNYNPVTGLGVRLNKSQTDVNKVDHARHITDEAISKAGFTGKKWNELTYSQQKIVSDKVRKEEYTKHVEDAEREYREDKGLEKPKALTAAEEAAIRTRIEADVRGRAPGGVMTATHRAEADKLIADELEKENKKRSKLPELSSQDKLNIKNAAMDKAEGKFTEELDHAAHGINAFTRVVAGANKASFDIRKISDIKTDKNAPWYTKAGVGLTAAVATGVRSGIIKGSGLSGGTVKIESDFWKDLGSVLTDSLKDLKIDVPKSSGGGGHSSGGGHGGGGHH